MLVEDLSKVFLESEILYLGLLPRHIEKCCGDKNHMQNEDIVIMHNSSKKFDQMVKDSAARF
jgi:hypothetical protein